jgi:hypothetical protein
MTYIRKTVKFKEKKEWILTFSKLDFLLTEGCPESFATALTQADC